MMDEKAGKYFFASFFLSRETFRTFIRKKKQRVNSLQGGFSLRCVKMKKRGKINGSIKSRPTEAILL